MMAAQNACMVLDDVPAAPIVTDPGQAQAADSVDPLAFGRDPSSSRQRSLGAGDGEAGSAFISFHRVRVRTVWLALSCAMQLVCFPAENDVLDFRLDTWRVKQAGVPLACLLAEGLLGEGLWGSAQLSSSGFNFGQALLFASASLGELLTAAVEDHLVQQRADAWEFPERFRGDSDQRYESRLGQRLSLLLEVCSGCLDPRDQLTLLISGSYVMPIPSSVDSIPKELW